MASLRVRMAASYVLVTAAAVLVVEATMLALLLPRVLGGSAADAVQKQANLDAKTIGVIATKAYLSGEAASPKEALNSAIKESSRAGTFLGPRGKVDGVRIPPVVDGRAPSFEAVVAPDGSILSSSAPNAYRQGDQLPVPFPAAGVGSDTARVDGVDVVWAVAPVIMETTDRLLPPDQRVVPVPSGTVPDGKGGGDSNAKNVKAVGKPEVIGAIYTQVPKGEVPSVALGTLRPLLIGGGVVLLLVLPVGVVFGLLSTRRLIRRVHRVAGMTTSVANGDFGSRVGVAGDDELGALEHSVNRMAEQLGTALETERRLAGAGARQAERARIARELHDSISQDLFSLSLLAGGLRRGLPEGGELRTQAAAMERTASRTMREMQALLLELRPVALEDAGLLPALEELCRAYETRLGIEVEAELAPVRLIPPAEHAVLRVTQEALGNAIKHGDPQKINVMLANGAGDVRLEVRDDGCGFDPDGVRDRHGMGLGAMRDRVAELGGDLQVTSSPGAGTTVRVRLPARGMP